MAFSDKALKLIIAFEGLNQPGKWPGAQSGVTLGYGYDLGYVTVDQFESDWEDCFTDQQSARLQTAVGKHGAAAQALAPSLADIKCSAADSLRVFLQRTIPAYTARARLALPGFDHLPLDAQGALVSLAYNRGTSMRDSPGQDNRREMRAVRDLVPRMDLAGIAAQLRSMKRLWQGKGLDGLIRRREAEAVLVDSCIAAPATRGLRRTIAGTRAISASRRAPKKPAARPTRKSPVRTSKRPTARKPKQPARVSVKKSPEKKPQAKKPASTRAAASKRGPGKHKAAATRAR
jgi:GH24 family phage-related lysozyme (muramidase)